ncbi:four helix bundle protein [Flavisolibacter tropicus]|uniref:30S ribosomal protein S23 n=1 Tax=Flavisolibacter tropicus TaxID=1492898 RepID=A0A172TYC7_9BACT|nr:four helix bundle protein [Flavisolibacter tropicus]ANE51992.1 hypothetical protein SY85_17315 [Flavisolibacter tropicus]
MIPLNELVVYKTAMEIGEVAWKLTEEWTQFQRDTLGKQIVRAADSIALNIAEGYGRFSYKENKQFCYYSRGSAFETFSGLNKAYDRKLISEENYVSLKVKFEQFFKLLNAYIKSIGNGGT